jgi:8-oxo-dGTP pyrophosphatase MutT (NUDIX family)
VRTRRSSAPNARSRVVVYVTREHPQTGADELLVFDLPDEPEYVSVVPGGRVESGETIEQTAVRELLEETGLEVQPVRELGVLEQPSWRVPGLRDENHFLQAVPTGETLDGWHHGVFRCRWIPVIKGMSVYGEHGAFLDALMRKRVVGYVTSGRQLLVLEKDGVTQLPAGRVEPDENLEDGPSPMPRRRCRGSTA